MFFQNSVIKKYLALLDTEQLSRAWEQYKSYFLNPAVQENIRASKEEQFQEGFLRELFVKVLGYTLNPTPGYNLITEQKNETDAKKADGAILRDGKVIGVIELKDHKTTDLSHVERQAFGYKSQHKDTKYVVISNFEKLRFYIDNAVENIEWNLFALSEDQFRLLYFCLAWANIQADKPLKAKADSVSNEDQITLQLYKDYSAFKSEIFADILKHNTTENSSPAEVLCLFKKTQKLLDRLLFIFFAEDSGLLPPNSMVEILNQWEQLKEMDAYVPLYDRIKKYFGYMNTGWQGKKYEIFAYNGGLFKPDEVLDSLNISDELLARFTRKLADYDYSTEVDVNILGHIFENSLSEIEEVTARINADTLSLGEGRGEVVSKRKRDGVFYTPQYITKYIVENTVGKLCAEKKAEMGIDEQEYFADKNRQTATKKRLLDQLTQYREWLLSITICDPACGSGAFLNAALQFLMAEHKLIDEMEAKLTGSTIEFPGVENSILENNLYGVDINEESVEIAKLALWLRTAKPHRKLSSLNNNIKCGNSLISDPEIAGEKAFNWQTEFPQVFAKGGFDIVIGNPPYVDIKQMESTQAAYLFKHYVTSENRINLYSSFIEQGYKLTKEEGFLSYINPNSMLQNSSYTKLRKLIIDDLYDLVKLPDDVFEAAKVETIIFALKKCSKTEDLSATIYDKNAHISEVTKEFSKKIHKSTWKANDDCSYNIYVNSEILSLLTKIKGNHNILGNIADFTLGITPYDKYKGHSEDVIKNRRFHTTTIEDETCKPLIAGENVVRYFVSEKVKEYIKYGEWLGAPREERFFTEPRIIVRQIVSGNPLRIYAGYTESPLYFTQIGFGIIPHKEYAPKYILTILDSKLMNFYHKYRYLDLEKELFQKILIANCKEFPIPECPDQQPFIDLADRMLSLNKDLQAKRARFLRRLQDNMPEVKITSTLETFDTLDFAGFVAELKKQKIKLSLVQQDEWEEYFTQYKAACSELTSALAATDAEIDSRVYDLYGLTDEERGLIEDN
ncbi:MAG: N-6 DNA methylase [Paludibacteraceae bacterium]|nr:N-6 DNA methylase [Paludibacteraceae bacterium]